jgi:hypothetical protein
VLMLGVAGLHQQLVDQRGLAVVDVGDDRCCAGVGRWWTWSLIALVNPTL